MSADLAMQADALEITLQHCELVGGNDRADIAVRSHQDPVAGPDAVTLTKMSIAVDEVSPRTARGRVLTDALDAARVRMMRPILTSWSDEEFADLVRLTRRFVDDLLALPEGAGEARQERK
ncbi:hypothetical protein [Bradyrhizobium prioriisuperbiae]|uniref:hypothetical protein n=1 Tax=Bradyrhizobium prioriisuperbiae TaxID=2854389 RepID=UPI0028E3A41A|nr:hypothetical protein [Bradyrhizobium prioritasuperba]